MKRETVGKIASDLMLKTPETRSITEQMQANLSEYEKEVMDCVERNKKNYPGDFYVNVITKQEPLLPNVFRNYFFATEACPTPNYDQILYKYKRKGDELVFMWTVPSRDACHHLKDNAHYVVSEEQGLLRYVQLFDDGSLFKLMKELNGEMIDSPLLEGK